MPDVTLTTLQSLKQSGEKITMLTCYDATFAQAASQAGVEVLLVGDSLGMVLQGHDSTLPVSVADMVYHVACVKRGNRGALILADLPFMAYATTEQALHNCAALMQAGAHMVKLEGAGWLAEPIRLLAERGIPACAHLGLTPQAVNILGGYGVRGKGDAEAKSIVEDAVALSKAGAFAMVIEGVMEPIAIEITQKVACPTIGIGASAQCDGQVLVTEDMLGLFERTPKFVKRYGAMSEMVESAVAHYADEVRSRAFPGPEQIYTIGQ